MVMTLAEGRAFRARWRLVARAAHDELRRTTPAHRFRVLAALMESREALGDRKRRRGVTDQEVYKRSPTHVSVS